jgi:hypothetical protein
MHLAIPHAGYLGRPMDRAVPRSLVRTAAVIVASSRRRGLKNRRTAMTNTFWEAIKIGLWDFQPHTVDVGELEPYDETPGAREKLEVLTEHLRRTAACWEHDDRLDARRLGETSYRCRPR